MPATPRTEWIAKFIHELELLHSRTRRPPMTTHYLRSIAAQQWDLRGTELEPDDAALLWHTARHAGDSE